MGAGLLLACPGAMGPDSYEFSRTRTPGVRPAQNGRGESRGDASFSIRVLGDASSMRAELGAILCALDLTPVDEELTILTDSLSAIHLLCRWRRKRILTPYILLF